jgi:hypothetical protein
MPIIDDLGIERGAAAAAGVASPVGNLIVDDVGLNAGSEARIVDDVGLAERAPLTDLFKVASGPEGLAAATRALLDNKDTVAAFVTRSGLPAAGAIGASLATGGAAAVPIALGGAIGGGLGELAGQGIEIASGQRQEINPEEIGVGTVTGALPLPGARAGASAARNIGRQAIGSGAFSAIDEAGRELARSKPGLVLSLLEATQGPDGLKRVFDRLDPRAIGGAAVAGTALGTGIGLATGGRAAAIDAEGIGSRSRTQPGRPGFNLLDGIEDDVGLLADQRRRATSQTGPVDPEAFGGGPRQGSKVTFGNRPRPTGSGGQIDLGFGAPPRNGRPRPTTPLSEASELARLRQRLDDLERQAAQQPPTQRQNIDTPQGADAQNRPRIVRPGDAPEGRAGGPTAQPEPIAPARPAKSPRARPIEGPEGGTGRAFGPETAIEYRYRIADLDDLVANDPIVQPSNRDRVASDLQVQKLARDFDPDRFAAGNDVLDAGFPIVGPDSLVESGNGRLMALRQIRAQDPERYNALVGRLQERAGEFGLAPQDFAKVRSPVLVRERLTDVPDRRAFAEEANRQRGLALSAIEQAETDARSIPGAAIRNLRVGETQTIDAALSSTTNREVVRQILEAFPENERAAFMSGDGRSLTPAGVARIKNGILSRTYGRGAGQRLLRAAADSTDEGIRNVEAGVFRSLGKVSRARELVQSGSRQSELDPTEEIAGAVQDLAALRASGTQLDDSLAQQSFLDKSPSPARLSMLRFLDANTRSSKRITEFFNEIADGIIAAPEPGQGSLLGDARLTLREIVDQAAARVGADRRGAHLPGILGSEAGAIPNPGATLHGIFRNRRAARALRARRTDQRSLREAFEQAQREAQEASDRFPTVNELQLERTAEQGAAQSPRVPPNVITDRFGRALVQVGRMSAHDPDRLAKSFFGRLPQDLDELQNVIATASRDQIQYARRGRVTIEQQQRDAEKLIAQISERVGLEPDEFVASLRKRGQAHDAAALRAFDDIQKRASVEAAQAAQRFVDNANATNEIEANRAFLMLQGMITTNAGARAEAGRALGSLRRLGGSASTIEQAMAKILKGRGGPAYQQEAIRLLAQLDPADSMAISRFVRLAEPPRIGDKLRELLYFSYLSGPQTHLRNIVSNTLTTVERPLTKPLKASIDLLRATFTGTPREVFLGEAVADAFGMVRALPGAVRVALKAFADEPTFSGSKFDSPQRPGFRGRFGSVIRSASQALKAEDEFFKAMNYWGSVNAEAYRLAVKSGRRGQARADFIAKVINDPTSYEGVHQRSVREAIYRTFTEPFTKGDAVGRLGKGVMAFRNSHPAFTVIMPFVRTPLRIAQYGIQRTPFNLVTLGLRKARGEVIEDVPEELTRVVIGSAIAASVALGFRDGMITGGGPRDPLDRSKWLLDHQPYSLKIGNRWIQYGQLEPLGMTFGLVADAIEIFDHVEQEDFASKAATAFAVSIGKNLVNKTFMRGVSEAFAAVTDPERYGGRWVQGIAGTLVPGVVSQGAAALDPTFRRPQSIAEVFQQRIGLGGDAVDSSLIPGVTQGAIRDAINGSALGRAIGLELDAVGPVRDIWGDPVSRQGLFDGQGGVPAWAAQYLSPVRARTIYDDPASTEVARLREILSIGSPGRTLGLGKTLGRVTVDPKLYDEEYVVPAGREAKERVTNLVGSSVYQSLDDDGRADAIHSAFLAARKNAREKLKQKLKTQFISLGQFTGQTRRVDERR